MHSASARAPFSFAFLVQGVYDRYMQTSEITTVRDVHACSERLTQRVESLMATVDTAALERAIADLTTQSTAPDFWDDARRAGAIMQRLEAQKARLAALRDIAARTRDLAQLVQDATDEDVALYAAECEEIMAAVTVQERAALLSGPYDAHDAIVTVFAGAGGTDAQDWAEILSRMYIRYAERTGFSVRVVDEARGTEAGYKSVTLEVRGADAYGMLRTEAGTHRLVRLSPFNADHLRQTSFARVEVVPVLEDDATEIVIAPQDIRVDTYRSQGAGGQSVNTTDSAVRITHIPTGIVVTCQNERSQLQNKEQALRILRGRLLQKRLEEQAAQRAALRGTDTRATWGSQIRSYILHPYKMVKDHRTGVETPQAQDVLDGNVQLFIDAALRWRAQQDRAILQEERE